MHKSDLIVNSYCFWFLFALCYLQLFIVPQIPMLDTGPGHLHKAKNIRHIINIAKSGTWTHIHVRHLGVWQGFTVLSILISPSFWTGLK